MSTIRNYCVMVTSTVLEAVWIMADCEEQALQIARVQHQNGVRHYTSVDRQVAKVEIVGQREVLK